MSLNAPCRPSARRANHDRNGKAKGPAKRFRGQTRKRGRATDRPRIEHISVVRRMRGSLTAPTLNCASEAVDPPGSTSSARQSQRMPLSDTPWARVTARALHLGERIDTAGLERSDVI